MTIPFFQIPIPTQEEQEAIQCVFTKRQYILGTQVTNFEKAFADYCGVNYAISVGNGYDALFLTLKAYDFEPKSEIILASHTYIATALAIIHNGLTPVFCDIDPQTYNIDAQKIESLITSKTKAIMVVHLYGFVNNMDVIWKLAKKYDLKIIEDAAQAHGSMYHHKKTGSLGDAAAFSFYPTKNLGCYGDGGIITTQNQDLANKLMSLRDYGRKSKYEFLVPGYNSRLDEIQAAVLNIKLQKLDQTNATRRKMAEYYSTHIHNTSVVLPHMPNDPLEHVWYLYVVQVKNQRHFMEYLKQHQIETAIHFPIPVHEQPLFHGLYHDIHLPITQQITQNIVSLPLGSHLTTEQMNQCIEVINDYTPV